MLTADLVCARRRGAKIHPQYVKGEQFEQLLDTAQMLIEVFESSVGKTQDELQEALKDIDDEGAQRVRVQGLIKLLKDQCEFDGSAGSDAEKLRSQLFLKAAEARQNLNLREEFNRAKLVSACAQELGMTEAQLEASLFCDLPGAQTISSFHSISPLALMQRYNLALAQGVLLRATRVEVQLEPASAVRYRELFRAIKFRRLMHEASGNAQQGYRLVLDGPMSLFDATQRYGLQLALFLPVLVSGLGWSLSAEILWGKDRQKLLLELSDRDDLVSSYYSTAQELEEVTALERSFAKLECDWTVSRETPLFDIKGQTVFVPDLVFEHKQTQKRVFLEAFGYWSREKVFERVELLDNSFAERFILAVSRKLRVSPEIADENFPGRILVYTQAISAQSVRKLLEEIEPSEEDLLAKAPKSTKVGSRRKGPESKRQDAGD